MLFTTKLEGANYAVIAIEKKENAIAFPTYNDQELPEGDLRESYREGFKKRTAQVHLNKFVYRRLVRIRGQNPDAKKGDP